MDGGWFPVSVGSGLKELITFRESRAQMIAPLPMGLAGLAGFPGPRAAGLRRVASFGLLWRRLCDLQFGVYGSLRLCDRLPGVCALPRPFWLLRCVCGSRRLSFLRSSAWGSSLPPFTIRKGIKPEVACLCKTCLGRQEMQRPHPEGARVGFICIAGACVGVGFGRVWVPGIRIRGGWSVLRCRFCGVLRGRELGFGYPLYIEDVVGFFLPCGV